jgi:hypothetical protein
VRALRSVGAVLAGLLAIFVLSMGTDAILHRAGVFPPWGVRMSDGLFALALAYRTAFDVGGCWLTARLAPRRPMLHALVLGGVGLVLSTASVLATWDRADLGPRWYAVALAVSSLPCGWVGGAIARTRRVRAADAPRADLA